MGIVTKRLRLESHGYRYKVALYLRYQRRGFRYLVFSSVFLRWSVLYSVLVFQNLTISVSAFVEVRVLVLWTLPRHENYLWYSVSAVLNIFTV